MSWAHRFIMCHGQDQGSVRHVNYEEQDQEGSDQVFCCLQIGPDSLTATLPSPGAREPGGLLALPLTS